MTITVITCRGIFERPGPGNMLSNLTNRLDRTRFTFREFLPWAAGFGDYDRDLDRVAGLLAEEVRRHQGPLILAGYSGGAAVVGNALAALAIEDRRKVKWTVLCADPNMPADQGLYRMDVMGTARAGLSGIAGARYVPLAGATSPVVWVADKGDPICQTPTGSPLRSLAAFLTSLGPDMGPMTVRMRAKLLAASAGRRYDFAAYAEANRLFGDYAFRGAHTRPYPALLRQVADDINRSIR